jgi:hypothetical protein
MSISLRCMSIAAFPRCMNILPEHEHERINENERKHRKEN